MARTTWSKEARKSARAVAFLARTLRTMPEEDGRWQETRERAESGREYDRYSPANPVRLALVVTGLTLLGERDPRLINFCRALAASGIAAAAPALAGLAEYRFEESDLAAIVETAKFLHRQERRKITLIGFSIGAGLALAAAADPGLRDAVDLVVLFGPYHDFSQLWTEVAAQYNRPSTNDDERDNYYWLRMVLAFRELDRLGLAASDRADMLEMLALACETDWKAKRAFFERVLAGRGFDTIAVDAEPAAKLQRLSAAGRLNKIKARVMIIHDERDTLIDPEHSRRIITELRERGAWSRERLLVTPLLSHVNPRAAARVMDVLPLLMIMRELFEPVEG
jgi:pimeloyl-ACP methyl ester carboxylesterase